VPNPANPAALRGKGPGDGVDNLEWEVTERCLGATTGGYSDEVLQFGEAWYNLLDIGEKMVIMEEKRSPR
jgi:hypothetical protein